MNKSKLLIFACILLSVLIGAFRMLAQTATSLSDLSEHTIMFMLSDQWASGDIYALNPENGQPVALITEAWARYPVWSRTNQELAFITGYPDLYVFNLETQEVKNLTQDDGSEISPKWSPDGKRIAFASNITEDFEVFVINRDGSEMTNLTNSPYSADGGGLDWSPDGEQIVFTSNRNGRNGIYVMSVDGSDQHLLVSNDPPSDDGSPVWSPVSNQIAFVSHRAAGYGIYLVNADGSDLTHLEPLSDFPQFGRYGLLAWSPDGAMLAYEIHTGTVNSTDLYLIDLVNPSQQIKLTENALYDAYPAWIPATMLESDWFPVSLPDLAPELNHTGSG